MRPPLAAVALSQVTPPLELEPGQVVVTFSFADTLKNQVLAGPLFAKYGMHATFYISAGRIGRPGYLTLADLHTLAAAGHEIGGHTFDHEELDGLPLAELRHQICDCRVALMGYGFPVTSFAYPFGSESPLARETVIFCGYNNARRTGRIRSPTGCSSCPLAETVPPADPYSIRAPTSIKSDWTLANLQSLVLQARVVAEGGSSSPSTKSARAAAPTPSPSPCWTRSWPGSRPGCPVAPSSAPRIKWSAAP
ncbi:polysaccharide deacetylase family protein [Pyxidicoccus sp. 3LFB2]